MILMQSILNTLITSVNRPGWCINVVRFDLIGIDGVFAVLGFISRKYEILLDFRT